MSAANWTRLVAIVACALVLGGCEGVQSTLAPQGPEAERVARLFWALTIGSAVILAGVVVLAAVALTGRAPARRRLDNEAIVIAGGIVFPIVTLTAVLVWSEIVMGANATRGDGNVVRIGVVGERWWWRVTYRDDEGRRIESANELRIPVGRPVEIELTSADVIHSFWVPKLAGKTDAVPNHNNTMWFQAKEAGVYAGQCAEFCALSHAKMKFSVVAESEADFAAWLRAVAAPAATPTTELARQGEQAFFGLPCIGCHTITGPTVNGLQALGTTGPNLTHFALRERFAGSWLENNPENLRLWLQNPPAIKPGSLMPNYNLSDEQITQLIAYLESLK
jgi:cytochrome c oxidase subunit 2